MTPPTPSQRFLLAQVHWAMGRGLPPQAAEDVVFAAWHKASKGFDSGRGHFEAYMQRIVRNDCAYWWRRQQREDRAYAGLEEVPALGSAARAEQAAARQQRLLDALKPEEREVFHAWALQRHLGKGRITSKEVGASIGLVPREYDNAKRRLRTKLESLLDRFGWSVHALIHGDDDVEQTG